MNQKEIKCRKRGSNADSSKLLCEKCGEPIFSEKDIKRGYRLALLFAFISGFICFAWAGVINQNFPVFILFLIGSQLFWFLLITIHKKDMYNCNYNLYFTLCLIISILSLMWLLFAFLFNFEF